MTTLKVYEDPEFVWNTFLFLNYLTIDIHDAGGKCTYLSSLTYYYYNFHTFSIFQNFIFFFEISWSIYSHILSPHPNMLFSNTFHSLFPSCCENRFYYKYIFWLVGLPFTGGSFIVIDYSLIWNNFVNA